MTDHEESWLTVEGLSSSSSLHPSHDPATATFLGFLLPGVVPGYDTETRTGSRIAHFFPR
eukprot:CAMPEP_0174928842 /NCGR_PEP_ID=MMETSP1355-20121228/26401_1 /TAXON_ID=464990 /ORGANISM="Hemiselmis tepida, Strain CCMP443" /LENGTH=59 /DNA_ID=CAMNT_0016175021 /DNA_START=184 /DNA_END=360 /DNA_ORIENTATION=-